MSEQAIVLAGFGGQGLLFAGQVLAQAALDADRNVTWLPSYGPEMRGGTASCTVVVADGAIGSPVVDEADVVVALTPPSLARYEPILVPGGLLVVNDSLIEAESRRPDVEVVRLPCSAIARDVGDERVVSVVGLVAAIARRPIVPLPSLREALRRVAAKGGPTAVEANLAALDRAQDAATGAGREAAARR